MDICSILGIKGNGLDIDSEQDEHNEKTENYDRLQDLYLKEINKQNALRENKSLKEILNEEKMNAVIKNAIDFQPKSFNKCDTARKMHEEMTNNTDYATKIFNKEDAENIFSITFCKVPVKSEEDE